MEKQRREAMQKCRERRAEGGCYNCKKDHLKMAAILSGAVWEGL
jgi:hypothetical protein